MRLVADQEGGRLLLNEKPVPGILQRVTVRHELATDDRQRPNRSGSSKQPLGFQDASVACRMTVLEDELEDTLRELAQIFYGLDERGRPVVYRLQTRISRGFGISQVLFSQLSVEDDLERGGELIPITLQFVQFRPIPPVTWAEKARRAEKSLGEFVPLDTAALNDRMATIDAISRNPLQLAPLAPAGLTDRGANLIGIDDGTGRRVKVGADSVMAEGASGFVLPKPRPKRADELFVDGSKKSKPSPAAPKQSGFSALAGTAP